MTTCPQTVTRALCEIGEFVTRVHHSPSHVTPSNLQRLFDSYPNNHPSPVINAIRTLNNGSIFNTDITSTKIVAHYFNLNSSDLATFHGALTATFPHLRPSKTPMETSLFNFYNTRPDNLLELLQFISPLDWRRIPHFELMLLDDLLSDASHSRAIYAKMNTRLTSDFNPSIVSPFMDVLDYPMMIKHLNLQSGKKIYDASLWLGREENRGGAAIWITDPKKKGGPEDQLVARMGWLFSSKGPIITNLQGGKHYPQRKDTGSQLPMNDQDLLTQMARELTTWAKKMHYSGIFGYGYWHNPWIRKHFADGDFSHDLHSRFYSRYEGTFQKLGMRPVEDNLNVWSKRLDQPETEVMNENLRIGELLTFPPS